MRAFIKITIISLILIACIIILLIYNKSHKISTNKSINMFKLNYKIIQVNFPSNSDPTQQIQQALNTAKNSRQPIKVLIPEGNFVLTHALHIYSNTWLCLSPTTTFLKSYNNKESMLLNGDTGANYYKYNGNSNIIIDGGIWDANGIFTPSVIGISHGKNIIVQNITVKDVMAGHAIDCAGNKEVEIRNNKFLGYKKVKNELYPEAIQIDGLVSKRVFTGFGNIDFTVSKNINIHNNYFGNSYLPGMLPWGVGVGSHTASYQSPFVKINIKNNVFEGMTFTAVRIHNWQDINIENNYFRSCNQGIQIDTKDITYSPNNPNSPKLNKLVISNINILENQFNNIKQYAIKLLGNYDEYQKYIISRNNVFINSKQEF
ncbi:hypothetical protein [Heyndrickxia camelliae]|uniref:Pectate lyase superfamily protein domain-containing protein n=1 Tax=Heyndrickxia camelliae TaxID=1707093 RepID=A0A2N3LD37_9BACI|nr:hypothetical protein [Heyndrickxia camelliae]PKR82509.1 hypothetical protein CWO92_24065 [Heyndrickxia camelliae]